MNADEVLAAAVERALLEERLRIARLLCWYCRDGDRPLLETAASRLEGARAAAAYQRLDEEAGYLRNHLERTCLFCRGGEPEACVAAESAAQLDRWRDHRATCRECKSPKGRPAKLCAEASRIRQDLRYEECRARRWSAIVRETKSELQYADAMYHVDASGRAVDCAASAVLLLNPRDSSRRP